MDWFNRDSWYKMPHVLVSTIGPKNGTPKAKVHSLSTNFYKIQYGYPKQNL